jgi:S-adenosylmethionine synthetase
MNERTPGRESKGFLDGDLIESFLDLRRDKMEEVCVLGHKSEEGDALAWEKIKRMAEAASI